MSIEYPKQGLSVGEVAAVTNLGISTIKTALKSGALESYQLGNGGGWRWCRPEWVEAWAQARGLHVDWDALPYLKK